ncbi:MAG: SWIM zinc finger family protein [Anaerolineales bacterium]
MSSIPRISKSIIAHWTDNVYFQRGQKYYEQGAIYEQRIQGMVLKSKCSGSQAPFYRQEVLFDSKGIKSAECTCPVGDGGHCKHTVALLLTWVNNPNSFQEVDAIETILEKLSKPELIALIKQMIEQEPDLESLLELPLAGGENKPLNIKAIRRQAEQAFQGADFEWGYAREIKRDLNPLLKLAAGYLSRDDAENSASIYITIIESIMDNENAALGDEEGELLGVIYECAEALGHCLSQIKDSKKRLEILQTLFSAYQWDTIKIGGVGAADCVPEILTTQTIPEERIEIAKWTRKILPRGNSWSDGYHRETLGRLLLDLESDILDDESYLKLCRETGRLNDLVERLLKLKRITEAEDAARVAEDYPLFKTLEIFTTHGQASLAEKLVTERLKTIKDDRLVDWLANKLKERGDLAGSLELEERLFWKYPNIDKYEKLRKLAKQLNGWDNLRSHIIHELESKKDFDFLVNLYLYEKEVGNALATLEKMPERWGDHPLHIEVAQAAKKQYPQESIRLFTKEAERFINYRDRGNYSQAALCLREIRDVYRDLKEIETWNKFIKEIRERFRKLPALQDELSQLKL